MSQPATISECTASWRRGTRSKSPFADHCCLSIRVLSFYDCSVCLLLLCYRLLLLGAFYAVRVLCCV